MSNSQEKTPHRGPHFMVDPSQIHQLPLSKQDECKPPSREGLFICSASNRELTDRVIADLMKHPGVNEEGFLPGEFTPAFRYQNAIIGFAVASGRLTTLPGDPHEIQVHMVIRKIVENSAMTNLNAPEVFACALMGMVNNRVQDLIRLAGAPSRVSVDVVVTDGKRMGYKLQWAMGHKLALKFLTQNLNCPCVFSIRSGVNDH